MDLPNALSSPHKILIVGPSWIGDMMMAQSLFILLKQRHPHCEIHVLALAWTRALLNAMPEVDGIIDMPLGHGKFSFGERRKLGISLRGYAFDQAIVLPNSFKSGLIPFFANIPIRTGWLGEMRYGLLNDYRRLDKKLYPLMVERYAALAFPANTPLPASLPHPSLQLKTGDTTALLQRLALTLSRPVMVICPGAEYGIAKRWPESYYAAVVEQKIAEGFQVWAMGSANDSHVVNTIATELTASAQSNFFNLAGATSLTEALLVMSQASVVLSNDSGLMHIAAALNKPLAVVFGSTSPDHTPPLADRVAIVQEPIECSPCFKRECPYGHYKCLRDLSPAKVNVALEQLLIPATHQSS